MSTDTDLLDLAATLGPGDHIEIRHEDDGYDVAVCHADGSRTPMAYHDGGWQPLCALERSLAE